MEEWYYKLYSDDVDEDLKQEIMDSILSSEETLDAFIKKLREKYNY